MSQSDFLPRDKGVINEPPENPEDDDRVTYRGRLVTTQEYIALTAAESTVAEPDEDEPLPTNPYQPRHIRR